ncbi:MAG: tetratricopeptide repeat protein [Saprospiraceae bacterium]|jgi:TolA-binding protein|nr:tetratricopeptide repeat protein [Saprospiraceae bacterium]MBK6478455.1 tetratricopeptide repeat protein [Saprospiraceae bacterium]MBK6813952.1 tetratricopeptide repeat protein [Saprospiraceae bacterium]MBK7373386.1 tetratricopeptide repeat protein [Saprospiraceae bacterium]MBK7437061.1 tetratricopeptide repeat protein [Saprospiraceae bacterium]
MKRKSLITCFAFFLCVFSVSVYAQVGKSQLGKVTYLEGQAQLTNDQVTTPVGINTVLYANQYIKTAPKSVVEILWSNGAKTSIEPSATYAVKDLFSQSGGQALAQNESVFTGFKKVFRSATESKRAEEGGIRRSKAKADTMLNPDQLYWKEDKEITFDEASTYYEKGDFVKAVYAFKTFLDQQPMSEMAKYATFALGHSYLRINNQVKARELFEQFILKYSNDELRVQAESVLAKFPAVH